jgi:hypothetical protein
MMYAVYTYADALSGTEIAKRGPYRPHGAGAAIGVSTVIGYPELRIIRDP